MLGKHHTIDLQSLAFPFLIRTQISSQDFLCILSHKLRVFTKTHFFSPSLYGVKTLVYFGEHKHPTHYIMHPCDFADSFGPLQEEKLFHFPLTSVVDMWTPSPGDVFAEATEEISFVII